MTNQRHEAGSLLFREGDRSRHAYRLVSGAIEVFRHGPEGKELVGRIGPGEYVGELGVLVAGRRTGTARFAEASEVEVYSRDEFLRRVAGDPKTGTRLLHVLSLRTRAMVECLHRLPDRDTVERLRRRGLLHGIGRFVLGACDPVMELLRDRLKAPQAQRCEKAILQRVVVPEKRFSEGSYLFREGDDSEHVVWVRKGQVEILKHFGGRERVVGIARRHEFVGEMGVLESMPRTAGARAASDVVATELSPEAFFELVSSSAPAFRTVIDLLAERSRRLSKVLRDVRNVTGKEPVLQEGIFEMARSIESVAQLAERRLVDETVKARRFFRHQLDHGKYMAEVYQRYLRGEAGREEMERANAYFRDYLKLAGIGALVVLPGSPITIPLAAKIGKALGIDIFPTEPSGE